LEYKSKRRERDGLPSGAKTFSQDRFKGAQRGFARLDPGLQIHEQPREVWMNLNPEVIRRPGVGTTIGKPQVLVNHARIGRGPWRLKALLDPKGHPIRGRFLIVRPKEEGASLLFLWSILSSPLANAYCFACSTKRDILKKDLLALPVPEASPSNMSHVDAAARAYLAAVRCKSDEFLSLQPESSHARDLLLALDAEVLRLYDLPPRLERQVLDLFAGWPRTGVPFHFDRYFPAGFEPWIPLHLYLSQDYQRSTAGQLRRNKGPIPKFTVDALAAAAEAFEE
jgi:hypothetical protein